MILIWFFLLCSWGLKKTGNGNPARNGNPACSYGESFPGILPVKRNPVLPRSCLVPTISLPLKKHKRSHHMRNPASRDLAWAVPGSRLSDDILSHMNRFSQQDGEKCTSDKLQTALSVNWSLVIPTRRANVCIWKVNDYFPRLVEIPRESGGEFYPDKQALSWRCVLSVLRCLLLILKGIIDIFKED